jgi:hypothetical protein
MMNCEICGIDTEDPALVINAYDDNDELVGSLACCGNEDCIEKFIIDYAEPLFPPDESSVDEIEISLTTGETVKVIL